MERYEKAAMEVINLGGDVITTSGCTGVESVNTNLCDFDVTIGGSDNPWNGGW